MSPLLDVSVNVTRAGDTASLFPEGLPGPTALVLWLGPLGGVPRFQGSGDPCATALGPGATLGEPAELRCWAVVELPFISSAPVFFGEEAVTLFLLLREMHLEPNEGSKV